MKQLMHIRVFELSKSEYYLKGGVMSFEKYVIQELQDGYVVKDLMNFGIENLRVISYYDPENAKKQLAAGSIVSNLTDVPAEEV